MAPTHPNILMVVLDTARADAFEPYGAASGRTPAVADLAKRGSALTNVYAPASWTVPSHASMFTGLMPRTSGLTQAPGGKPQGCKPVMEGLRDRVLPEVLRRNGYATAAISANVWIQPTSGFDVGFDEFHSVAGHRVGAAMWGSRKGRLRWMLAALQARLDDGATAAEGLINTWVDGDHAKPFFWFVNLLECHSPYMPPQPYNYRSPVQRLKAARDAERYLGMRSVWEACLKGETLPEPALRRMRRLYQGSILQMDDWLARILEALQRRRLLDDTLVIITSDHGENLGEGKLMGHAFSLDQRLLSVPLVSGGPGAFAPRPMTSLVDLPALIAGAAGIAGPPFTAGGERHVVTAQWDTPAPPGDPRIEDAIRDMGLDEDGRRRLLASMTCATDGALKLVREDGNDTLFDLAADPLEVNGTALRDGADGAGVRELRRALDEAAVATTVEAAPVVEIADSEREELEAQMKMLGYL